ncbi:MAG: efflux RND transporter permease subunit, partial [Lachnospiraceae bacterium]|nr:efflux RND transporter permease subunit [Lachnospiraceae bacterium]
IITAKADLEATKMHFTAEIATLELTNEGYNSGISQINETIKEIEENKKKLETARDTINMIDMAEDISVKRQILAALTGIDAEVVGALPDEEVEKQLDGLKAGINAELNGQTFDEAISALDQAISELEEKITEMESQIAMNNIAITQMQTTLADIEGNIAKLDAALIELYQGNLTAAIEFANAQTAISLGELQITTAESQLKAGESQLEAGEEQIKSGEEQLEAGREQIESAYEQLNDTAEQLADALQQILDGEEELEEAREDAYDKADMSSVLTVDTVKALLAAQNFSMPAGYVTEEGISYLIRVGDKPRDIEELKKMPLLNTEMDDVDVITLGDVADVFMTDNSADIYANVNGAPGIMVTIQKQTGYSTGDVSDKILDKFAELMEENENLMLITLMDQGIYIDLVMDSIINNILFGAVLAILILILFLKDLRPTAVIACSIPISLVTAIVCMYFSGVTLNVISLSGLALGIGMLVDNSIVVIENIYRMRKEGLSSKEAAVEGAGEVAGAIMASTLTTVCVFLPIVFTEGITRQLFVDMGLTIAYSLLASLAIALTVVPAMASKMLTKTKEQKESRFFTTLIGGYEKLLYLSLKGKPIVLLAVVALLVFSAIASYAKGTAFMPEMDSTQMTLSLTMPDDTPLDETAVVTDEIVDRLLQMEEVTDVGAMASTSSMSMLTGSGDAATNAADVYISLSEDKKKSNKVLAVEIEEMLTDLCEKNNAEIDIETSNMDMSALGGSGISIQVRGREIDTMQRVAEEVAEIVKGVEGTQNVSSGLEDSTGEMRILIDRDKAIEHGLTVAEIFQQISVKLADASSSTTLETEIKEYDVYVKHGSDMELTRSLVKNIEIDRTKQDGTREKIPLSELASFEDTISPKSINRTEQTRYIGVSAEIADGYNVGLVSDDVERALKDYQVPTGYSLVMSGENETITDAMEQLYLMLLLALIFMYLIMVAQFQSLLSPFIIMFTIPLAFTGGFLGLVISGSELSVIALIGFVMLSGIIVNNGIVLVDYMNQLRAEGMEKKEAILTAGKTRLRPVLMTALTTILALCTMVFSNDMGSEMAKPMAIVTIGGLVYGTLLT